MRLDRRDCRSSLRFSTWLDEDDLRLKAVSGPLITHGPITQVLSFNVFADASDPGVFPIDSDREGELRCLDLYGPCRGR